MKTFWKSFKITLAFCVLLGVGYVLVLWIFAQVAAPNRGEADVVVAEGRVVGAANVGQTFTDMQYFWGRPSAVDYNGGGSGGSNKATTNPEYLADLEGRVTAFLEAHPYLNRKDVPSEIVTASGSGLDPDISPRAAYVQVKRVAEARGIPEETVKAIVDEQVKQPWLGLFGTAKVNVLKLNLAVDAKRPYRKPETSDQLSATAGSTAADSTTVGAGK